MPKYEQRPKSEPGPLVSRVKEDRVGPERVDYVQSRPSWLWNKLRWALPLLPLLFLLLWLFWPSGTHTTEAGGFPHPIGTRTTDRLDVCLVMDDSGSELETDPTNRRYNAANTAVKLLGEFQRAGEPDRVCVVHFGGASVPSPLLPVDAVPLVQERLRPMSLGDTMMAPALRSAVRRLGPPEPGVRKVVILFTDGVPSDPDDFAEELRLRDVERVHVLAYDQSGNFDSSRPYWESLQIASIRDLSSVDDGELDEAFARDLVDALGMTWGES